MVEIKKSILYPFEICEFSNQCNRSKECDGTNDKRQQKFSCGLRRLFLLSGGHTVDWKPY